MKTCSLQDTGIWKYVEELLDTASPTKMLVNLCCLSAATSAVLTNDTTCLMLTPLVMNLCRRRGAQSTLPFLMAVATSSNIGSSLTIIGNPQNALIASISPGMGFLTFMKDMLLPVLLGLFLNTVALWCYFRKSLVFENPEVPEIRDVEVALPETNRCLQAIYVVAVGGVVLAMIVGWMWLGANGWERWDLALMAFGFINMENSMMEYSQGCHCALCTFKSTPPRVCPTNSENLNLRGMFRHTRTTIKANHPAFYAIETVRCNPEVCPPWNCGRVA